MAPSRWWKRSVLVSQFAPSAETIAVRRPPETPMAAPGCGTAVAAKFTVETESRPTA
ncbi:hypothetical protein ACIOD0_08840 [Kitasatospora albolonga]